MRASRNKTHALQNLNALFQPALTASSKQIKLLDGELTLIKRPNSRQWQCRFKLSTGQWHVATTGSDQIEQAKQQAVVIYETIRARIALDLSANTKTFKMLALEELANMRKLVENKTGKCTYKDYTFAINKYLIPFFGKFTITEITAEHIADFEAWRISEMGLVPKSSTKRNHASAYNRIINLARQQKLIHATQSVPILDARGDKGEPRPAFTSKEIEQLLAFMVEWERGGRMVVERVLRPLCRVYVEFLIYTGVRHGTEAIPLRWRHLQWHWIGDKKYLRIWVSGKTGPRYLIGKHAVLATLERIIRWHGLEYKGLDEVIEAKLDKLIFCYPNGKTPYGMEGVFSTLMRDSGLAKDAAGKNRTLYSLRHTYATFALAEGVDIHTLAKQMGTSTAMIEKHYSKITPMMSAEKLA